MKLDKEIMLDILYGASDKYEVELDELESVSRWSTHYDLVFKDIETGKFYRTSYSQGATEQQDESPWEYEDEVESYEVKPVEVTKIEYHKVD